MVNEFGREPRCSHFPFLQSAIIIAIRRNRVQMLTEDSPARKGTSFLNGTGRVLYPRVQSDLYSVSCAMVAYPWRRYKEHE